VADYGGFDYDSDYYGDDLPFWMQVAQNRRQRGAAADRALTRSTATTCALPLPQGYSHADPFFQYLKDTL